MSSSENKSVLTKEDIQSKVVSVLQEMTADWDLDNENEISSETSLMEDLAFESIDVVQLVVALEKKLDRKGIPFEKLFIQDGDYVEEVSVGELVNFLNDHLKLPPADS
jgi:acyl carrier protein